MIEKGMRNPVPHTFRILGPFSLFVEKTEPPGVEFPDKG
jgi:hypothetical protein